MAVFTAGVRQCYRLMRFETFDQRRHNVALVVSVVTILLLCAGVRPGRAQDGAALMRKMADAYQHLNTYEVHSNVDVWVVAGKRTAKSEATSADMQCKRPNKLTLVIHNNTPTGTRSVYSDGTTLTIYDALPKHYYTMPAAPNMQGMMNLLAAQARISANLDPLYFFCTNKLPPRLTELKAAGKTAINGRPSLMVTGVIRSQQAAAQKNNAVTTNVMHWTWYIDQETYLLNKLEAHSDPITTKLSGRVKGKPVQATISVVMNVRNSVGSFKANPPLDDGVFVFHPPADATGQRSSSR
jgi:outer membrane lipoprotein-sorting protein